MRAPVVFGAGVAVGWSLPALAPIVPAVSELIGAERRLPGSGSGVAITFDDGPHPEGTPAVLDVLRERRATATFFLVGEQVQRHRSLAAEIAAAGHRIALHGHRHRLQLRFTPQALADDLSRGFHVVTEATGREPEAYRPPYGIFSPAGLAYARRHRWRPLLWSRWGRDWAARATPESIAATLTEELLAGDVLLLHDADWYSAPGSHRNTAAALPRVLDAIEARGLAPAGI
jgi:peptidoglycan/xylan/chitin deacetylase (PgdA/CDA1 family)